MVGMPTPISAVDFFAAKLAHQTDPADLAAARAGGAAPLVLDVRSAAGWSQGRIPGAVHLPGAHVRDGIGDLAPELDAPIVVYCWGPGCNGATRAAFTLASMGYTRVQELIGGFEYWAREGLAIATGTGRSRRAPDDLVAPVQVL
ncbi:rhodanese-like domain-containing protein [Kineococcus esterisolvens]|uniref:rhodanese-like domain-containing protein n=1 Tax=unclassified Kineococcus TaxID=2621656 RepID=UPI003D7CA350